MAETLIISPTANKEEKYESLIQQIDALTSTETDFTANLANIASALKFGMDFFWVGFYVVKGKQLVLAPFQGTLACTRINYGKGVCGSAWEQKETILVDDVEQFKGHIACSTDSKSEIVVPAFDQNGEVFLILDVDSDQLNDFDETDKKHLEKLARIIEKLYQKSK